MFLKKLEIQGFKSFADRIHIEFQPGVNAIVGPNGSGKSNITDAIRWVLGEQSIRSLRGSKLEDIIFAGSLKRKPLGMAEVTVVLDNEDHFLPLDFTEVSITRRVFRSGESEFYLNKVPCRLKDIQELLMDTGIGKDGYSIISQGEIDEFLLSKPEERRLIFEETAGITKHKARKKESEKKLEETSMNISRLDDLINELEFQLESLYAEREKAIEYKRLSEIEKEVEVNIILMKYEKLEREIKSCEETLTKKEEELENLKNNVSEAEEKLKSKNNLYEKEFLRLENLKEEVFKKTAELSNLNKDLEFIKEKLEEYKKQKMELLKKIEELSGKKLEYKRNLKEKTLLLERKICDGNSLESKVSALKKEIEDIKQKIFNEEKQIEDLKSFAIEYLNSISEKKNILSSLKTMSDTLKKRKEQILEEINRLEKINHITFQDIDSIDNKLKKLEHNSLIYKNGVDRLANDLFKLESTKRELQKLLTDKISKYHELQSRLKVLQQLDNNYEGYPSGVRNLLLDLKNGKVKIPGIYGSLAELIFVEKDLEVAIEAALGGSLLDIVCENEEAAKKAVEYLKKNNLGRATFLPLTMMRPKIVNNEELNQFKNNKGFIGAAESLVKYDNKFKNCVLNLLGRVLVFEDIDSAILSFKKNPSFKIVTLDGEIISPAGSITGGSFRKSSLLLSRKREIVLLKNELDKINEETAVLNNKIYQIDRKIENKNYAVNYFKKNIETIKIEIAGLIQEKKEKKKIQEERKERIDILNLELNQIEKDLQEIDIEIVKTREAIDEINSNIETNQQEIEKIKKSINYVLLIKEKKEKELEEVEEKLALFKNEEYGLKLEIQHTEENLKAMKKEILDYSQRLSKLYEIEEKTIDEKNIKEKTFLEIAAEKDFLEKEYERLKVNFREIEDEAKNLQKEISLIRKKLEKLEALVNDLKIKKASFELEKKFLENNLFEKYKLNLTEALKLKKDIGDIQEVQEVLNNVKEEISKLGEVNLGVIEEYEKIKSRQDFLKSQREDLISAKEKLNNLIYEITKTMEKMFVETFEKIRAEFQKVFAELFGGGKADIYLIDKASPLETGIEIVAQPPGKKLQNINLLSGGERSLTAIALLFAILNVKPTPFCILDEIEAALDDANIERFANYVKKVSKNTQFIIITHRKGTMEIADALYGISMEETAVSKVVSIKV
ncbi:MAG: chromosome segregation protein SMC [Thermovenabulum sp.]|uniref:chromosome segregation protein SMC n=1 Tax=Thermovenabulum sp. TaxID=3100335 RepID=UPI003C799ACE